MVYSLSSDNDLHTNNNCPEARLIASIQVVVWGIPRAVAQSRHTDCKLRLGPGEKMPDFPAIYLKSRWVIKSGRRWSEPIGGLIDVEESCRLGLTSAVASMLAASTRA